MRRNERIGIGVPLLIGVLGLAMTIPAPAQYMTASERAAVLLTTAKAAFNDGNYPIAAEKFREYLKLGAGGRLELSAARYGLGVSLIEGPARDYAMAVELLAYPAQIQAFKERPYALYYLGVAYRGLGDGFHTSASTRPAASQPSLRRYGDVRHTYAVTNFAAAAEAFLKDAGEVAADVKQLPVQIEWAARARCDQAEILIKLGRFSDAAAAAGEVLDKPLLARTGWRTQAAYYRGYADFGLKKYPEAVQALSTLAPFDQPDIGIHARYLLARVHHMNGERPEAMANYQAMVGDWEQRRKEMQAKALDRSTPAAEKERLQAQLRAPVPEYVSRAMFYWGVALSEFGKADDATSKLLECIQLAPDSPIAAEARLRAAVNGVAVRRFKESAKVLEPLLEDAQLADQALRYLAKSQYGIGATPVAKGNGVAAVMNAVADPAALASGIKLAIATYQKADEKAQAMSAADPQAAARRAVILLEMGDLLQLDKRYKDAAASYAQVAKINQAAPEIAEQSLLRQAIALQLGSEFAASDKACSQFINAYPRSENRPEAMLRYAENALLAAYAAGNPAAANTDGSKAPYAEAIARFNRVITRFPDSPQANMARMGLATIHYLLGQFSQASEDLNKIPESERGNEMAGAALLLADCQLRALPTAPADDAISSARLANQLESIITQLETYVQACPNEPEAAEAYLRMGYAANKLAALMADPIEKRRALARGRRAYATIVYQFKDHPLYPIAALENAKTYLTVYGGGKAVLDELVKFQSEPLSKTGVAPMALLHLAEASRSRRKPDDAITLLTRIRAEHESALLKDAERSAWVPVIQYSLALSLKEAGRYAEARDMFEKIAREFPKAPAASEVPWRLVQCRMDPAIVAIEQHRKALLNSGKLETQQEALASLLEDARALRLAAEEMGKAADDLAQKDSESEVPLKMNYDAAWCWRTVGEIEVDAARRAMQIEEMQKTAQRLTAQDRDHPVSINSLPRPEIALASIPLQPGEQQARAKYKAVIESTMESPLIDEARIELADLLSQRNEYDASISLFKDAIGKAATPDYGDRLRLRMATLMLGKGDARGALDAVNDIMVSGRVVYAGYAKLTAVEAAFAIKDYNAVIEHAKPFLEVKTMGRVVGVADYALLRMANAQQHLGQWAESRTTLEMLLSRFPSGYHIYEAKFALAQACEKLKEYDKAIGYYGEVAARNGGEMGVKSWFQIGVCRMAMEKPAEALSAFLTVAYAYDCPDLNASALCEAAKASKLTGDVKQARVLLHRAIRDYPNTQCASAAKKQLIEMQ